MPEEIEKKLPESERDLLIRQIELSESILERTKYIKRYIIWQKVFGWIKFFLILIPLLIGLFYLPPLIKQLTGTYQELLSGQAVTGNGLLNSR
ncbi:MAG TPA: hypothetical protein PKI61_01055 [bacterium]|nr:hypothetical protein [bacterium]HPT29328.1 hypothetical protein [bacterium]